ncbi:hypothetical protein BDZ90DRAFT_84900 [Jaminaea rosea]|uniref:Uncharacterized protein n=1 Tax=Jaminaea rosea TaxID=1569628 RepID=A0A316UKB3_9BASI|nr:hypothetical protein BDZ90DRAFT_84900 [Jaminaea rosea]PWN25238.1 hypothetical protein BDZ90DRAFT_84900 [Jaminaea rosea]
MQRSQHIVCAHLSSWSSSRAWLIDSSATTTTTKAGVTPHPNVGRLSIRDVPQSAALAPTNRAACRQRNARLSIGKSSIRHVVPRQASKVKQSPLLTSLYLPLAGCQEGGSDEADRWAPDGGAMVQAPRRKGQARRGAKRDEGE